MLVLRKLLDERQPEVSSERLSPGSAVDRTHLLQDVPEPLAVTLTFARFLEDRLGDHPLFDQEGLEGLRSDGHALSLACSRRQC